MANKKKRKPAKKGKGRSKQSAPRPRKRSKFSFLVLGIGFALIITGAYFLYQREAPKKPVSPRTTPKGENIKLRETRPTLSPERFSGRIKKAYRIAREIPEVLDRLYCYCRCRENFGHKNLLSCYVDNHAAT
jgi:hypothetical protein